MPASDSPVKSTAIGWEALRANLRPALVVQVLMLLVVIGYYWDPHVATVLGWLAEYKRVHGILFVVGSTVLAASILPELLLVLFFQGGRIGAQNFRNILFTAPLWAVDGITVDLLYRWLAQLVGDEVTFSVVAIKICIDQFGYSVLFAAPYGVIAYEWKNSGFSFAVLRRCFTFRYYRDKIVPTLLTIWAVWIPLVAMIYSLPLPVQFPLFSLALTFWVLLFTYMTNRFAGKDGLPADFATANLAAQPR
ncbi:hypothetical protein BH18VER1_BH18VER1_14500 [soil metagenome]